MSYCRERDIQPAEYAALAEFPLILGEEEWRSVAEIAERLTVEALAAEQELIFRADLHGRLGLPPSVRKVLRESNRHGCPAGAARVMRFDFHFTSEGWRISEVNPDYASGYIEAAGFTELLAPYYPRTLPPPNPAIAYVKAIRKVVDENSLIGLVHRHATTDIRELKCLVWEIKRRRMRVVVLGPRYLRWESNHAKFVRPFATGTPSLLVRYLDAEWLPNLHPGSRWKPWFSGGGTPVSNPASAVLIKSKRFPLTWNELNTPMLTWRSVLPETRCPSEVSKASPAEWVFKSVFGRAGKDVAIAGVASARSFKAIVKEAKRDPSNWVAQRRFQDVAVPTGKDPIHVCLGIFTVDGIAVGAYGRMATKPLIDQEARDVAILLRKKDRGKIRFRKLETLT
jgi:glutathionylspermidine synthase